jgi:hypothetical protein
VNEAQRTGYIDPVSEAEMRRPTLYNVHTADDTDGFGQSADYETALRIAREAARERAGETILITYKGWGIRELVLRPEAEGQLAEEELTTAEEVDRTLRTLAPPAAGKQP